MIRFYNKRLVFANMSPIFETAFEYTEPGLVKETHLFGTLKRDNNYKTYVQVTTEKFKFNLTSQIKGC